MFRPHPPIRSPGQSHSRLPRGLIGTSEIARRPACLLQAGRIAFGHVWEQRATLDPPSRKTVYDVEWERRDFSSDGLCTS